MQQFHGRNNKKAKTSIVVYHPDDRDTGSYSFFFGDLHYLTIQEHSK
jgi:hypothetical protein